MTDTGQLRMVRFGLFEVDLRARELRKNGVKIRLQEQPFQVLAILLQHAGDIVTREELRRELWPADTFVDFEHGLNAAVKRLRDALGDSAENPLFIETLARRGYRFNAQVDGRTAPPSAQSSTAPSRVLRRSYVLGLSIQPKTINASIKRWGLTLVVVVALIASVLFRLYAGGLRGIAIFRTSAQPQIHSLAVLPLTNLSGDPQQDYFADGMTDELITELSRIGSLKVISRTSVMQYKGEKKKPLPQIGRELNVDAVMEGSVLRSGNQVRIAAHMIYAPADQNLMTETYERSLGDVLRLQREVAEAITQQVRTKLTPEQQARFQQAREVNPEAYQAYLLAISLDRTRQQEIKKSQIYLEKAIQKDPGFAPAHVELAWRYNLLGMFRWLSPQDAYPPAKQALRKGLELDENNCNAHFQLAFLGWRYDWDWQAADKEFRRALELCPSSSMIHVQHAYYSAWNGRRAEALAESEQARELDPLLSDVLRGKALVSFQLRNYKDMIEAGRQCVASDANSWLAHYLLGIGYEGHGQPLEAIPEYQKAVELSEGNTDPIAALAHAYAAIGRRAEAKKILREWQRQSQTSYVSPYMISTVYASLGEKDKAFEYLEKAYEEKSSDLSYFLRSDLRIDNLRSDSRFVDLLRRMSFPSM